jgi:putative inorganic carbon (hco3(-)) transporter
MRIVLRQPATFLYLIISLVWIVLFSISLAVDNFIFTWIVIAIVPALVLLLYLFIKPELFLFWMVFFIPLSQKMEISGGSFVSFPSEVMAVLLVLYMILNYNFIRFPDRRIFKHPLFIILLIYLSWLVLVSATSEIPTVSFKHTFIQVLYFIVFFLLFLTRFDKIENILKFFLFYSLGMVIPVIHGMIWHAQYHFNPQASYYMPQPFFIEHTIYGAALAFIIPALFYLFIYKNKFNSTKLQRTGLGLLLTLMLLGEFLAFSRAAWLSLLILPFALPGLLMKIRQGILLAGFVLVILVAIFNSEGLLAFIGRNDARSNRGNLKEQIESVSNIQTDISNLERINRWKSAIRMFQDQPIIGHGPGTFQFVYYRYQVRKDMTRISTYHGEKGNAHSEYLGLAAEAGFPGCLIYLILVLTSVSVAIKIIHKTQNKEIRNVTVVVLFGLVTFYIHTIFNGFIETEKIGSLVFGSLAAITALDLFFDHGKYSGSMKS